jgi:hypothetical protein
MVFARNLKFQTNPITLTRFIMEESVGDHKVRTSLAFILQSIGVAAKVIFFTFYMNTGRLSPMPSSELGCRASTLWVVR